MSEQTEKKEKYLLIGLCSVLYWAVQGRMQLINRLRKRNTV